MKLCPAVLHGYDVIDVKVTWKWVFFQNKAFVTNIYVFW